MDFSEGDYDPIYYAEQAESSFQNERIASLKLMVDYQKRLHTRLSDQLAELEKSISNQVEIISSVNASLSGQSGTLRPTNPKSAVFQVMQNIKEPIPATSRDQIVRNFDYLFKLPSTQEIINYLDQSKDFRIFFLEYPLAYISVFDFHPLTFNMHDISMYIETWPQERRALFFEAFFEHISSLAHVFSAFMNLIDCQKVSILSETIETTLPQILNCDRVCLFIYDEELIVEKQQFKMHKKITCGRIVDCIKTQKQTVIASDLSNFSCDDKSVLKDNKELLATPVVINGRTVAVIFLFDKIGGFKLIDSITSSALSAFIAQILPVIREKNSRKSISNVFQSTLDTFLSIVSTKDFKSLLDILPKVFAAKFNCQAVRLFRINPNESSTFSEISNHSKHEKYPLKLGIVGQVIDSKRAMRIAQPELSTLFHHYVDRPDDSIYCTSILVCPILDDEKNSVWAIALYNKIGLESFTEQDVHTMKMLCAHLNNVLESVMATKMFQTNIEHTKQRSNLFTQIIELMPKLCCLSDLETVSDLISAKISQSIPGKNADLYFLDRKRKIVYSTSHNENFEKELSAQDPICIFTSAHALKRSVPTEDSPEIIYCGIRSTTDKQPLGLIKLTQSEKSICQISAASLFQSNLSLFSSGSISSFKSMTQLKLEKLANISTTYEDLHSPNISDSLAIWEKIVCSFFQASTDFSQLTKRIKYLNSLFTLLPSNARQAVQVFKESTVLFPDNSSDNNKSFVPILPYYSDEFISKTREFIETMTKLLQDTFEVPIEEPFHSSSKHMFFNSDFEADQLIGLNTFDVFHFTAESLINNALFILEDMGVIHFLYTSKDEFRLILRDIRSLHSIDEEFNCWELAVDHLQFLYFTLRQINVSFEPAQVAALAIHFLLSYAKLDISDEERCRFYMEHGHEPSVFMKFLFVAQGIIPSIPEADRKLLEENLTLLQSSDSFDDLFKGNLIYSLAILGRYSYLARSSEISTKWITKRFMKDIEEDPEFEGMKDYLIEYEVRTIVMPACGEMVKKEIRIEPVRKLFSQYVIH